MDPTTKKINQFDQVIYTDGSCCNNGKLNSIGGIGVFINTKGELSSISEPLTVNRPTNQIAELFAIYRAVELSTESKVLIVTDSKYSLNCLTVWHKKWIKNNWKLQNGNDIKNIDLIKNTLDLLQSKKNNGIFIKMHHMSDYGLYSHGKEPMSPTKKQIWFGNQQADKLSKIGSNLNLN